MVKPTIHHLKLASVCFQWRHSNIFLFYFGNICWNYLFGQYYSLFVDRERSKCVYKANRLLWDCHHLLVLWLIAHKYLLVIDTNIFFMKIFQKYEENLCIMSGIIHQYTLLEITITTLLRGTDLILMMLNIIIINNHHLISVNKIHKILCTAISLKTVLP